MKLMKIPSLTNEYFLENFIGGLNPEIMSMIKKPQNFSMIGEDDPVEGYQGEPNPSLMKYLEKTRMIGKGRASF